MDNQVSVGVVGTSWYADLMHLPALNSHPDATIAAICGRDGERAQEMADKYGIPQVFADYREMIAVGGLDAIVIAVPDDLHYPITMAALSAGLHVLCEKPMALTVDQATEMLNTAEAVGVKHMICFTWRWLPPLRYVHQLISQGYLGQCYFSQFRYVGGYGRDGDYAWRWDGRRALGILGDLGVHMIDMAHWFLGDISSVNADLRTFVDRPGLDGRTLDPTNDSALLTVKYDQGGHGVIYTSSVAYTGERGQEMQLLFHGESGTIEVEFNFESGYVVRGARGDEEQLRPLPIPNEIRGDIDPDEPVMEQLGQIFTRQSTGSRLFVDSIVDDQSAEPNFVDGVKAQKIMKAAIESDTTGCWVPVV